jgi:hypothetical protein
MPKDARLAHEQTWDVLTELVVGDPKPEFTWRSSSERTDFATAIPSWLSAECAMYPSGRTSVTPRRGPNRSSTTS